MDAQGIMDTAYQLRARALGASRMLTTLSVGAEDADDALAELYSLMADALWGAVHDFDEVVERDR